MRQALGLILALFVIGCTSKPSTDGAKKSEPVAAVAPSTVRAKSSAGAKIFIVEPANGATVTSPLTVKFGVEGIALEPAGAVKDGSGHHHLLIDTDPLPPMDQPLPFTDKILHFGQAQTETSVNLTPGTHTLQLIFAGGNHIPHDPPVVSEKITITVQ